MSLSATDDQRWPTYFPSLVTYCQYGASPTFVQANRCSVGDVVMITPDAFTYKTLPGTHFLLPGSLAELERDILITRWRVPALDYRS